jgi:hypothetical protein
LALSFFFCNRLTMSRKADGRGERAVCARASILKLVR